jgi:hypothetical protein
MPSFWVLGLAVPLSVMIWIWVWILITLRRACSGWILISDRVSDPRASELLRLGRARTLVHPLLSGFLGEHSPLRPLMQRWPALHVPGGSFPGARWRTGSLPRDRREPNHRFAPHIRRPAHSRHNLGTTWLAALVVLNCQSC